MRAGGSLNFDFRNTFAKSSTKPPTSKIRLIKILPHQNIAPFNHDFMAGHMYQTANRPKSRGSVSLCIKALHTKALRTKALHMEALRTEALHDALHDALY